MMGMVVAHVTQRLRGRTYRILMMCERGSVLATNTALCGHGASTDGVSDHKFWKRSEMESTMSFESAIHPHVKEAWHYVLRLSNVVYKDVFGTHALL